MIKKISVTEALNELKLYDSKINKAISNMNLISAAKKSATKVGTRTKDEFIERAKSDFQSVNDLIRNRNCLKSAIVNSNAVTNVTIGDKTMTVAEAIERKSSIQYEYEMLDEMKRQFITARDAETKENKRVDSKVDELLSTLIGKDSDKKINKEDQEAIEKPYRDKNEFELIDPLNIYDKMLALETELNTFDSEVNTKLVLSNATTFIELDF